MWLAHGHRIDHSTLAAFRKRNKSALKKIHSNLIQLAKDLGIIRIAELYVDGTRIAANSSRSRTMTAEKASKLLDVVQKEIDDYLERIESADQSDELFDDGTSGERLPEHLNTLNKRKEQLEGIVATCNEMDETRKKQGVDPKKNPFQLPLTDQDSRILPNKDGGYAPNYTPIIGVEGELGLIVSSTIINSVNEQDYLVEMVDEVEQIYEVTVSTVGADAAFSTGANICELEVAREKDFLSPHRNGDTPHENPAIRDDPTKPVDEVDLDKLPTDPSRGTFSTEAFAYDQEKDAHHCPQGRELNRVYQETRTQSGGQQVTRTIYQSASCDDCPLVSRCRPGTGHKNGRRVSRDEYEEARVAHRQKMSTEDAKTRYNKRFSIGERPFGQLKRGFGLRRFQTRGEESVSSEFSLAGLAHNLLRMTNYLGSTENPRALLAANG